VALLPRERDRAVVANDLHRSKDAHRRGHSGRILTDPRAARKSGLYPIYTTPLDAAVMPYAFVEDIAASWHRYESYAAAIAGLPPGLILHVAGPTDEGFRIIDVWESEASWQRFRSERLLGNDLPAPRARFRALRPVHVVYGNLDAVTETT
jgi:hypothetical protein